jgi:HTH-type transcriptional regulator, global nitrogen regulator NrpRI
MNYRQCCRFRSNKMDERARKLQTEILKILRDSQKPLGSTKITEELAAAGIESNERTVRFHLHRMDDLNLTRKVSRRMGRVISSRGMSELEGVNILGRLGFIVSKIDGLSYNMNFDPVKAEGSIVMNVSFIPLHQLLDAITEIELAFQAGLGMGNLAVVRGPGEKLGNNIVPIGKAGIGTICSVTLNGLLLKAGIPIISRFGSLLRLEGGKPVCFTELVDYLGTTIDPLEVFLQARMTSVHDAARGRSGVIGASFREVPMVAASGLEVMHAKLQRHGLGGILAIGKPNQPLFNVSVNEGMIGVAVVGGLNPIAAAHEAGVKTENSALHSLADYSDMENFEKLRPRAEKILKENL